MKYFGILPPPFFPSYTCEGEEAGCRHYYARSFVRCPREKSGGKKVIVYMMRGRERASENC